MILLVYQGYGRFDYYFGKCKVSRAKPAFLSIRECKYSKRYHTYIYFEGSALCEPDKRNISECVKSLYSNSRKNVRCSLARR